MPLYVFGCAKVHRTEHLRPVGTTHAECDICGEQAPRVYGYAMALTQPELDTRGMFRRFTEASAEYDDRAGRIEASTGRTVQTPNLWQYAKARAAAEVRAGENPVRRPW